MWETLGHISIRIFMKTCELPKHGVTLTHHVSWKFVHGPKSYGNSQMNMKIIKTYWGLESKSLRNMYLGIGCKYVN